MTDLDKSFMNGVVTARNRYSLRDGEAEQLTGAYYKPGDSTQFWKLGGRSTFDDTSSSAAVTGVALCQFDSGGTDALLALSSATIYNATPGLTGTFDAGTAVTGATSMDAAHANDRWYLALAGANKVLQSDGTLRAMGMQAPVESPVVTNLSGVVAPVAADTNDAGFTNPTFAYTDKKTFAGATLSAAGSVSSVYGFTSAATTPTGRKLVITWSLVGSGGQSAATESAFDWVLEGDTGAFVKLGAKVRVKTEVSEDGGTSYTTVAHKTIRRPQGLRNFSTDITDTKANSSIKVRITLTYVKGIKTVTLQVRKIRILSGSASSDEVISGMRYALTEYNQTEDIESSPSSSVVAAGTVNGFQLTLPSAGQNSAATHWRIYRTADSGSETTLGLIDEIPIAQTNYVDNFDTFSSTEQPSQPLPTLQVTIQGSTLTFPRDVPPPDLRRITTFKGSLVGLTDLDKRSLYYSIPGLYESWPEIYVITSFPLPEHDELIDCVEVGGSLVIAAQDAMLRLDDLPQAVSGTFIASKAEPIKGAPGCVGNEGMTVVNYGGVAHAAWISHEDGILVTDGDRWRSISRDIDWSDFAGFDKSGWCLHYLRNLRALVFCYSSTASGDNDRYYLLHLDDDHVKENGQAKVTGPHYGKIAAMASGRVSNTTRIYSAHPTDGKVYVEQNSATGADSSLAYDSSGTWPLIAKSGRDRIGRRGYAAHDAWIEHTDFGSGQTATVAITVGRFASGESEAKSKSVSLSGEFATQFNIGTGGHWMQYTITHTGTGLGAIGQLQIDGTVQSREGKQTEVA